MACLHHPSDRKHLNSIQRADRQNYLQDEACNYHYYPNKAITRGWRVYAEKAMLQGLGVSNHPALQPDRSSLFAAYAVQFHHT